MSTAILQLSIPFAIVVLSCIWRWQWLVAVPLLISLAIHSVPIILIRNRIGTSAEVDVRDNIDDAEIIRYLPPATSTNRASVSGASGFEHSVPAKESTPELLKYAALSLKGSLMQVAIPQEENLLLSDPQDPQEFMDRLSKNDLMSAIDERLRNARGTKGKITISLIWDDFNDLDLHVISPDGQRIYWKNRLNKLDVDRNVSRETDRPIENIRYVDEPLVGTYTVFIDHFNNRSQADSSYLLRIEVDGKLLALQRGVASKQLLHSPQPVFTFQYPAN